MVKRNQNKCSDVCIAERINFGYNVQINRGYSDLFIKTVLLCNYLSIFNKKEEV